MLSVVTFKKPDLDKAEQYEKADVPRLQYKDLEIEQTGIGVG